MPRAPVMETEMCLAYWKQTQRLNKLSLDDHHNFHKLHLLKLELTDHQHLNGMNGVMIGMFTESIKYGED